MHYNEISVKFHSNIHLWLISLRSTEAPSPFTSKKCATNVQFDAKFWGTCKCEHYTKKSYIRYVGEDGKLHLVIGSQHDEHVKICRALIPSVKAGLSKKDIGEKRDTIVKKMDWDVGCHQHVFYVAGGFMHYQEGNTLRAWVFYCRSFFWTAEGIPWVMVQSLECLLFQKNIN